MDQEKSQVTENEPAPLLSTESETLAKFLKDARTKQGLPLTEVSEATGVPLDKLESMEKGLRRQLPADAFVRGFIRIYTTYLKIDTQTAISMFENEFCNEGGSQNTPAKSFPFAGETMATPATLLDNWPILLIIIIIIVAAFLSIKIFAPTLFDYSSFTHSSKSLIIDNKIEQAPPLVAPPKTSLPEQDSLHMEQKFETTPPSSTKNTDVEPETQAIDESRSAAPIKESGLLPPAIDAEQHSSTTKTTVELTGQEQQIPDQQDD